MAGDKGKAQADAEAMRLTAGAHLRAELRRLGLDQVAVSKATGVSRQTVNNIINGRQAISRAMAGKLGRLTGHSSDYWLGESFSSAEARHPGTLARVAGAGLLVNHQIARAVKDGIIAIEPFAPKNLQAASIDLTLNNILTTSAGDRIDISRGKGYALKPGHSVTATTKERVELPSDYLGRTGAVARLGSLGIVASSALQIEPGFKGRLQFCLFNAGGSPFHLRALDPVLSLEIIRLSAMPDDRLTI
jgi:deoxycytidine triphosphate deaminase/addiction module HigA family antidote